VTDYLADQVVLDASMFFLCDPSSLLKDWMREGGRARKGKGEGRERGKTTQGEE